MRSERARKTRAACPAREARVLKRHECRERKGEGGPDLTSLDPPEIKYCGYGVSSSVPALSETSYKRDNR